MISVLHAQEIIQRNSVPLEPESVPLAQAHGRVLRESIIAPEDMPAFDRSAMDGYVVRADEASRELTVVEEIRAGQAIDRALEPGQAMRIFTGARMPGFGLKVVMQEDVEARDGKIGVIKATAATNVRRKGEDVRAGEVLLEMGTRLDAAAVALLASLGQTAPLVSKKPHVLHITTGDEIVPHDQTPEAGQIRNSNAFLISTLCREQGVECIDHFHASDDLPVLLKTVAEAKAETYDVVLISGGSGHGDYDLSAELFRHLEATIHFREVNVRPGKPLIFGRTSSQIVFGLPGNALSHYVCFHLFVRRTLAHLGGREPDSTTFGFLTTEMTDTHVSRETWWPAQITLREGKLTCHALRWKSSGDITRLPAAGALIKVPASTSRLDAGTMVELLITRA